MNNNLDLKNQIKRENGLKKSVYGFALRHWSFCRLIIEVFLRKNFGFEYFNLWVCFKATVSLFLLPTIFHLISKFYHATLFGIGVEKARNVTESFYTPYITWYIFAVVFFFISIIRYRETKRTKFKLDFSKSTMYAGDFMPIFFRLPFLGQIDVRKVETRIEPAVFFILGIILWYAGQMTGLLFIVSSIMYSLSHAAQYNVGDEYIYQKNNEGVHNTTVVQQIQDTYFTVQHNGGDFYVDKPQSNKPESNNKPINDSKNGTAGPHIFSA